MKKVGRFSFQGFSEICQRLISTRLDIFDGNLAPPRQTWPTWNPTFFHLEIFVFPFTPWPLRLDLRSTDLRSRDLKHWATVPRWATCHFTSWDVWCWKGNEDSYWRWGFKEKDGRSNFWIQIRRRFKLPGIFADLGKINCGIFGDCSKPIDWIYLTKNGWLSP